MPASLVPNPSIPFCRVEATVWLGQVQSVNNRTRPDSSFVAGFNETFALAWLYRSHKGGEGSSTHTWLLHCNTLCQ